MCFMVKKRRAGLSQPACKKLMLGWKVGLVPRDDQGASFDDVGSGDSIGLLKGFNGYVVASGNAPEGISFLDHVLTAAGDRSRGWNAGRRTIWRRCRSGWRVNGVNWLVRSCIGIVGVSCRDPILVCGSSGGSGGLLIETRAGSEEGDWCEQ